MNRIIIAIRNGCVQEVFTNSACEFSVLDYDNMYSLGGSDGEDTDEFRAYEALERETLNMPKAQEVFA